MLVNMLAGGSAGVLAGMLVKLFAVCHACGACISLCVVLSCVFSSLLSCAICGLLCVTDSLRPSGPPDHRSGLGSGAGIRGLPASSAAEPQRCDQPPLSGQRTATGEKTQICPPEAPPDGAPPPDSAPYLGAVPLLRFLHVGGRHAFILDPQVPQCCRQVGLGHVHLHLHLLGG